MRLYYSVKLLKTDDLTYYIALCALWTLPEMASAFLAVSLPVFPKFFRNLSGLHPFSWITISERYLFRSSKTAHFQPLPNNFVLPTNQPKKSIVLPAKQDSPVYKPTVSLIGTSASDQDPVDNSSKLKTGNSRYQIWPKMSALVGKGQLLLWSSARYNFSTFSHRIRTGGLSHFLRARMGREQEAKRSGWVFTAFSLLD